MFALLIEETLISLNHSKSNQMLIFGEREKLEYLGKEILKAEKKTNKLNPHIQ